MDAMHPCVDGRSHYQVVGHVEEEDREITRREPLRESCRLQAWGSLAARPTMAVVCGRFSNQAPSSAVRERFQVELPADYRERTNIAPTQPVLAIRHRDVDEAVMLRWGLIPVWASDIKVGSKLINARAESLAEKASFKELLETRRCLIPADGFYEWRVTDGKKQPLWFRVDGGALFSFAGLWTAWRDREHDERVESCTIITTAANELVARVHDRMPVILDRTAEQAWLDPEQDGHEAAALLLPFPAERMSAFTVSPSLNSVNNDGADLTADAEPVELRAA
jgi:putative SOS response-associated peptidase YedK